MLCPDATGVRGMFYPKTCFATDGAAMFLRRSMLEEIQFEQEFFDEDFVTGKEDLDISWRAQLLGWKCLYVPLAVGWHVRTFAAADRRATIAEALKVGSVRNRYLMMMKNDLPALFFKAPPAYRSLRPDDYRLCLMARTFFIEGLYTSTAVRSPGHEEEKSNHG